MTKRSKTSLREAETAAKNRRELIAAQLTRRDMMKMGLLTSAGYLVPKHGLSARPIKSDGGHDNTPVSPPARSFIEPLTIMAAAQAVSSLSPAPAICPNTAAGEGRTRCHQALAQFPPQKLYEVTQQAAQLSMSPDLPLQTLWTFNGMSPGPTYHANYGAPILVRNINNLPTNNGGFGKPSVTTHLHNGHTPSESDGDPCDFFEIGHFYDQHYPNILAGALSDHQPDGDVNESLSTLWYHDHRVDFTSQNVYKGLFGFYLLFNHLDSGDETTGFHLPSGDFDVPMVFSDKVFDSSTGLLAFDLFNLDGILGDKFLVNGKVQPFFQVHPRKYRFRWLDGGPSRFYELFLTDPNNLSAVNSFWRISNDGNLFPKPVQVSSVRLGVAERTDVIIDFSKFAGKSIYIENRLQQTDGRKPGGVLGAGQGNFLLRFDVVLPQVTDNSQDPATISKFYDLPSTAPAPVVTRTFNFARTNGMWAINGKFADCNVTRFKVTQNTVEHWILVNSSGGWQHPIHIHFEEFQILSRNGAPPSLVETSRKDVVRVEFNNTLHLFFRFRDFLGRYPMHCHNLVHEDHAMMLIWEIAKTGDTNPNP